MKLFEINYINSEKSMYGRRVIANSEEDAIAYDEARPIEGLTRTHVNDLSGLCNNHVFLVIESWSANK